MKAAAVLYVKQLDRMRSFYEQCFGLEVGDTAADHCVLESETWTLSLVVVPDEVAATIHNSVPPRRRPEAAIKLAFDVPSIDNLRAKVVGLGGQVDPSETQWDFQGFRRCDGVDPEGNVVQLMKAVAGDA